MPPKRAKTYHEVFDEQERDAAEKLKKARNQVEADRYRSDIHVIQSMRRRHNRGEFPMRKREDDS